MKCGMVLGCGWLPSGEEELLSQIGSRKLNSMKYNCKHKLRINKTPSVLTKGLSNPPPTPPTPLSVFTNILL